MRFNMKMNKRKDCQAKTNGMEILYLLYNVCSHCVVNRFDFHKCMGVSIQRVTTSLNPFSEMRDENRD